MESSEGIGINDIITGSAVSDNKADVSVGVIMAQFTERSLATEFIET